MVRFPSMSFKHGCGAIAVAGVDPAEVILAAGVGLIEAIPAAGSGRAAVASEEEEPEAARVALESDSPVPHHGADPISAAKLPLGNKCCTRTAREQARQNRPCLNRS